MIIDLLPGYLQFLGILACFAILGLFFAWRHKSARNSIAIAAVFVATFAFVMEFGFGILSAISSALSPNTSNVIDIDESVGLPCENAIINVNSTGTFYTCPHSTKINNIVFQLPSPVYKKMRCYGCGVTYGFTEIVPPNLLSEQQRKTVIDKVMSLPETKLNSGWTLDHFIIQPRADTWIANVQLFLADIKQLSPSQDCGWYGQAEVDLETLEIRDINNIPPRSDVKC